MTLPEADVAVLVGDIQKPLAKAVDRIATWIAPHVPCVVMPGMVRST